MIGFRWIEVTPNFITFFFNGLGLKPMQPAELILFLTRTCVARIRLTLPGKLAADVYFIK